MRKVEIVGAPIDVGINIGEPRFAENEVVFLKGINKGVEVFRISVALEVNGSGVFGDGGAVGKNNRNGVLFLKRGTNDVSLN